MRSLAILALIMMGTFAGCKADIKPPGDTPNVDIDINKTPDLNPNTDNDVDIDVKPSAPKTEGDIDIKKP